MDWVFFLVSYQFQKLGIRAVMLTGDTAISAAEVEKEVHALNG